MQTVNYDNTNAFLGLGSTTVYIFVYFANVFAVFALKIYIKITDGKYGGQ
jgi:hypothetical protein